MNRPYGIDKKDKNVHSAIVEKESPMSILATRPDLTEMWRKLQESAEKFRRTYRLLPDGTMVERAKFEMTEPKKPTGGDHATQS